MRRSGATRLFSGSWAVVLLALAACVGREPPPNIIFILADDLGYGELGCYGQALIETPNLDRLAAGGIRFTQAYAGGPVCAASRSVLMTGQHNGHTAARDNVPHYPTYLRREDVTLAEVLKGAGYRCGGIGKWSLGDPGTEGRATAQGFDSWFGYLNQDHAHYYYPAYLDDDEGRLELPENPTHRTDYSHDLMTGRTLDFIRETPRDRPFFFYAAYTLPHFGSTDEDPTAFPVPSDAPYQDRPGWDRASKNYAAMITRLDRDVGRIVDLIDELGLSGDTLIVFSSDNGPWGRAPRRFDSAGPLRGVKTQLYEGGIRVPFIARWPGTIPAGAVSDEVIGFHDILPTFAELAGVPAPGNIDGTSIVAALKGGAIEKPHEYFYWDYGHCRPRYDQAVRLGDWKGVRLGRDGPVQLFDLADDPGETTDVAGSHPGVVARIRNLMSEAVTPSAAYPVGSVYRGKPIWQAPGPPRP